MTLTELTKIFFFVLSATDVPGVCSQDVIERNQECVNRALLEYCSTFYAAIPDKFGQMLILLHEVRLLSLVCEEFLSVQHARGNISDHTLLAEMLNSRRT